MISQNTFQLHCKSPNQLFYFCLNFCGKNPVDEAQHPSIPFISCFTTLTSNFIIVPFSFPSFKIIAFHPISGRRKEQFIPFSVSAFSLLRKLSLVDFAFLDKIKQIFSVFSPCHVLDHWLPLSSHQEEWHSKQNTAECLLCPEVYKLCSEVCVSMFTVFYSVLLTEIQPVVCNAFWICFHTRHHSPTSVHFVIPVRLPYLVHFQWLWIAAFTLDSVWMLYSYSPFQLPSVSFIHILPKSLVYPSRQTLSKSKWLNLLAVAMELHTGTEHTAHVGLHARLLGLHLILHLFIKYIVLVPSNSCIFTSHSSISFTPKG